MALKIENRQLVLPGDMIADGDYLLGEGAYKDGTGIYSNVLGLCDAQESFIKVIPLKGKYVPRPGDLIIGVVIDIAFSMWNLDINSYYGGVLSVSNGVERYIDLNSERLSDIYAIGDVVLTKVDNVSESMVAGLTMKDRGLYKLNEGKLISISPTKVPRVIGKKGTMIQMIKDMTGCRIVVGQNGRIWVSGVKTDLAIETIRLIEKNAHKQGLTDEIQAFLTEKVGRNHVPAPQAAPANAAYAPAQNYQAYAPAQQNYQAYQQAPARAYSERPASHVYSERPAQPAPQRMRTYAPASALQAPAFTPPAAAASESRIIPMVKKLSEAMLPKLKGAEAPKKVKDEVDDMEVF